MSNSVNQAGVSATSVRNEILFDKLNLVKTSLTATAKNITTPIVVNLSNKCLHS